MLTHLSEADNLSDDAVEFTLNQISAFTAAVDILKAKGHPVGKLHIQESYGILNYPDLTCDYARAGIALYGVLCKNDKTRLSPELRPVLALKAKVAEVKRINSGEPVSYSRTFIAKAPMKIATVTIGYADGVPRNSTHRDGYVLLHGQRAPIIGRICMDLMVIDVTKIDDAKTGDIATVIGRDGDETIRCEDFAESCGTITNEILSRLGARLPRIFI
jgi:serine/alanine racemase